MTTFSKMLTSRRNLRRNAALAAVFTAVCPLAYSQADDDIDVQAAVTPPPYSLFQYSTLTGSTNTINATRVPIVTSAGQTIYKNITLLFDVDGKGNLTIAPGYPKTVTPPGPVVSSFRAGRYVGPANLSNLVFNVSGPGIAPGGAQEWSLAAATGSYVYMYPSSGTWYVGSLATSPLAARIKTAGITSTAWSYGVGGACNCSGGGGGWYYTNSLLGFSQTGNALTIVSFTDFSGKDHNEPVSQITYTLAP